MWDETGRRETARRALRVEVPADQVARTRIFIAAPPSPAPRSDVTFSVRALDEEGGGDSDASAFERPGEGQ